ncbi:hypothetical protein EDC04DRAFT_2868938 [Pisolithus marmoratus]|nr:hypothetical protein EDC04DRAFT_2868938 [Pisolithus marmoratus]
MYLPAPPPVIVLLGQRHLAQNASVHTDVCQDQGGLADQDDDDPFAASLYMEDGFDSVVPSYTEVIPALIDLYLLYLKTTQFLHQSTNIQSYQPPATNCVDSCPQHIWKISCVLFDHKLLGIEEIKITFWSCAPAPVQLISYGLFPCSPVYPSLAVDLHVLELVRNLIACMTPNTAAWCEALESFLDGHGYKLTTKENLCCCFANAYHWYVILTLSANDHVAHFIQSSIAPPASCPGQSLPQQKPSEYLCSHCPLCFSSGHSGTGSGPDCIVSMDACFTQKHANNPNCTVQDPPNPTDSFFVSDNEVQKMESFVDHRRNQRSRATAVDSPEVEDGYEDGMRIPTSVLNSCGQAFIAADEKRQKASTRFFADTGLMALLCCHDCVLWLVNMTSAGEKQHFALTLVKRLFDHLPADMTVGLLYDIACQFERSCRKWELLDDSILSCLKFAVSVFHAYGHQWACQCVGFGMSDGEGFLIPTLHVSGFHQCLFALDNQIQHLDVQSLFGFGQWLSKKWKVCQEKKLAAAEALQNLDVEERRLRKEWAAQVSHRQNHYHNKDVDELAKMLALEKTIEGHHSYLQSLEQDSMVSNIIHDVSEFNLQLAEAQASLDKAKQSLQCRLNSLGISQHADLDKMKKSVYLQTLLNAHSIKTCIRDFRLEQPYRSTVNELRLSANVHSSIKHHEPTIVKLVSTYNKLCDDIHSMVWLGKAPHHAIHPPYISGDTIFSLDVDDEIWNDIGLDEGTLPCWLADETVRQGIRLQLEVNHCNEEVERLSWECCNLQEWMIDQWKGLGIALQTAVRSVKFH